MKEKWTTRLSGALEQRRKHNLMLSVAIKLLVNCTVVFNCRPLQKWRRCVHIRSTWRGNPSWNKCVAYNTCDKTKAYAVTLGKFKLKGVLCREVVLFSDAYKGKMGECHFYR